MELHSILITGKGFLSELASRYYRALGYTVQVASRPNLDITNLASVQSTLDEYRPDLILNTAAFTNTTAAEATEQRAEALAVNVDGALNLAYAARSRNIPWIQLSTGMMYDGTRPDGQGWEETDIPNPTNYYSWTKAWADAALTPFSSEDQIIIARIQTPVAGSSHPRNFLERLERFERAIDVASSVTVVEDLFRTLDHLVQHKHWGLFHVVNPGTISAYRITEILKEEGRIPSQRNLERLSRAELDALTQATNGAHQTFPILSTAKLEATGITLPPVEEAVRAAVRSLGAL